MLLLLSKLSCLSVPMLLPSTTGPALELNNCFHVCSVLNALLVLHCPFFLAYSILSASFINIPFSAPLPKPAIIAVGVAKPRAHGQAITNTVTSASKPCVYPLSPPNINHTHKLTMQSAVALVVLGLQCHKSVEVRL